MLKAVKVVLPEAEEEVKVQEPERVNGLGAVQKEELPVGPVVVAAVPVILLKLLEQAVVAVVAAVAEVCGVWRLSTVAVAVAAAVAVVCGAWRLSAEPIEA